MGWVIAEFVVYVMSISILLIATDRGCGYPKRVLLCALGIYCYPIAPIIIWRLWRLKRK